MRPPSVTIITATYNLSSALRYTIQSALQQTHDDSRCWSSAMPAPTTAARRSWMLACRIDPQANQPATEITLHLNRTVRPFDVSPGMDRRWLGVAVNWIELTRLPR